MATREPVEFAVLSLPETMDIKGVASLTGDLLALRGRPLRLDASRVQSIGGLCFQVLLSARSTWAADKIPIAIVSPSAAFQEIMALFGVASFAT